MSQMQNTIFPAKGWIKLLTKQMYAAKGVYLYVCLSKGEPPL